jgi:uncharacterized protein YdeI (YjbR/CyaY-like superfamily)
MGKRDPRIDEIIDQSQPFARPVMRKLRTWVHKHCPDVQEDLKWGHPSFMYKGKILCGMAAFKQHCTFGFWHKVMNQDKSTEAMGQFGRMTSVADLPSETAFAEMVKRAMKLEDDGVKPPRSVKKPKPPVVVPDDLSAALKRNKKAQAAFDAFSTSCRREYVEWITEAKRRETREKRLLTALEWIADGKGRNWQYERK